MKLTQYDVEKKKAKRQERYANGVPNYEMYPKGHAEQQTVNDWKFTSDAKSCKEFNKHYVVLQQKTICLKPGERHQYDVDTPGFGMRFDKYLKIAQAKMRTGGQTGGIHVPLAEVQSTFLLDFCL